MSDNFRSNFENFKRCYSERKTFRWMLFSFPKTFGSVCVISTSLLVYYTYIQAEKNKLRNFDIINAIYANDNISRRSENILLYGKNNVSK